MVRIEEKGINKNFNQQIHKQTLLLLVITMFFLSQTVCYILCEIKLCFHWY